MRRQYKVLFASLLLLQGIALGEVVELDLSKAIDLALENNIQMQNAKEELIKAKAQKKEAFSSALPVVSAFGQASHNFSIASQPALFPFAAGLIDANGEPIPMDGNVPARDPAGNLIPGAFLQGFGFQFVPIEMAFGNDNTMVYGLNLTQPLFEGRVIAAIRGAGALSDLTNYSTEVTRLSVIEKTKQAFYGVLLADKMIEVFEHSLTVLNQNLDNVKALYDQGKTAEFDVIRAEVQVANQTTMVSNARKMKELAYAGLKRNCGIDLEDEISAVGELQVEVQSDLDLVDLEARLMANQPLLNQLEASVRLMKENILMVRAEFMPSIALTGSYQQMLPYNDGEFESAEFRESSSLAIGFNLPIFNGFGSTARIQLAKAEHRKTEYQLYDVKENLLLELQSIYLSIQESSRKIEAGQKGVEQARKGVDMAQRLYKQGMASQLQVMDAQSASDQAELGLYQAYFEYNNARASLARALGEE